jgi:ribosome-associated heat shock protein Hsp15
MIGAATGAVTLTSVRVDSWLWAVRVVKTRSAATAACRSGHVSVNDERAKAAQAVKIGDVVRVRLDGAERTFSVTRLVVKRVGAPVAAECYVDLTPPPPPKAERVLTAVREPGSGRPTKRDRRKIERLMGQNDE